MAGYKGASNSAHEMAWKQPPDLHPIENMWAWMEM
jgi:hypothetical protein